MKNLQTLSESKATLYFDTRRKLLNGAFPIKIRLYHKGEERSIPTAYSCHMEHWIYGNLSNPEYKRCIERGEIRYVSSAYPNSKRCNHQLQQKLSSANQFLEDNEGELSRLSVTQVKDLLREWWLNPSREFIRIGKNSSTIKEAFEIKIKELIKSESWGNLKLYEHTLLLITHFLKEERLIEDLELIEIDKGFLIELEVFCRSSKRGRKRKGKTRTGMTSNSISIVMRCLRHIINRTIDNRKEVMRLDDYPFRGYKIPSNKTIKKAVRKEDLDKLRLLPLEKFSEEWHHRNYFFFLFNCQGMNLIDMAFLKRNQLEDNRLRYMRTKTRGKTVFDIRLTEEALVILSFYEYRNQAPEELVFPLMKDVYGNNPTKLVYDRYKHRLGMHNRIMKDLAVRAGIDTPVTSYVARHTWASIGFEKFESIDTVGQGLGHQSDPKVTKVYARDLRKTRMDEVNSAITKTTVLLQTK